MMGGWNKSRTPNLDNEMPESKNHQSEQRNAGIGAQQERINLTTKCRNKKGCRQDRINSQKRLRNNGNASTWCSENLPMARKLVSRASPLGVYVSHMTRTLATPSDLGRNGSRKIRQGRRITSESSPGAWSVEDPSKFHLGRFSTASAWI